MHREIFRRRTRLRGASATYLASAVAGALFVPYALTKGHLTSVITTEGWHLPGLAPVGTAKLFHVAETIPMALVALGLLALHTRVSPSTRDLSARGGLATALAGVGLTFLAHLGEHLLPPFTVPALTGGENLFMWGYYLSWLVLYAGLALYGVALVRTDTAPSWLSRPFVFAPPAAVAVAAMATASGVFTVAGSFRVVFGLHWVLVGLRLWRTASVSGGTRSPSTTDV